MQMASQDLIDAIITGDCRNILPTLPDKWAAFGFADPPYWVGFQYRDKTDAEMDYIEPAWLVSEMTRICEVVCITPGIANLQEYPKADWCVCCFRPGATGQSRLGGFNIWEPILVYGTPHKKLWQDGILVPFGSGLAKDRVFHNCPKPEPLLSYLVEGFTEPGQLVLDPVSGSGTTCKAAYQLGRHYLGIEIDPVTAELSRQRLAQAQPPLFTTRRLHNQSLEPTSAIATQIEMDLGNEGQEVEVLWKKSRTCGSTQPLDGKLKED